MKEFLAREYKDSNDSLALRGFNDLEEENSTMSTPPSGISDDWSGPLGHRK